MQNIKNVILVICLCFSLFLVSCENSISDAEKAEQVFSKEIINKYKDYDKKPTWAISRDITNKLKSGEYADIEKYIDYLVVRKPYTINGTRVLEDVYHFVSDNLYSSDLLDKWCAKTPSHHSSFIFRGYYYVSEAWRIRGSGFSYTVSDEGRNGFRKKLNLAEKDLEKAYSMNPEDPNCAAFMITVCMGLSKNEEEMDIWFNRAIKADLIGNNSYGRKQNYLKPKWHGTAEKEREFAEYCYKKAPRNSVIHEGMLDYIMDNSPQALNVDSYYKEPSINKIINNVYKKTIKNFPYSVSLRAKLAKIETSIGNYDKAIEQYSEALVHDPGNPQVLLLRGNVYLEHLAKYELAEADYKGSFESDPGNPVIYYQLAEIYMIHNNFAKSDEYYTKAIKLRPKDKRFFIRRGTNKIYFNQGHASALEDFKEAEKLDDRYIKTNRYIAECLEQLNRIEEAKEYCRKTLDLIEIEKEKGDGSSISSDVTEEYTEMLNGMLKRLASNSSSLTKDEALLFRDDKDSGILTLNSTSLTPEIAEILVKFNRGLAFPKLESISPEVADILGHNNEELALTGLKELNYSAASNLARNTKTLDLSGLKALSVDAAKGLGEFGGEYLKLNGLETLSPDAASYITKCRLIELNGLTHISNETITGLSKNKGNIFLEGIKILTPEKARRFAQHEGALWFTGMIKFSPGVVKQISKHNGELGFPRIKEISIEEAEYFGKQHDGLLNLGDITNLSDDAARALYDHDGPIELYNLKTITPAVAELLLKKAHPNITFQASSITPEVAEILAKHTGVLFFDSLTEIDDKTVRNLAKHKEEITLMGIKEVSPEVMEIVRGSHGFMRLSDDVKIVSKN